MSYIKYEGPTLILEESKFPFYMNLNGGYIYNKNKLLNIKIISSIYLSIIFLLILLRLSVRK